MCCPAIRDRVLGQDVGYGTNHFQGQLGLTHTLALSRHGLVAGRLVADLRERERKLQAKKAEADPLARLPVLSKRIAGMQATLVKKVGTQGGGMGCGGTGWSGGCCMGLIGV
jgi:hypothetical protein